MPSVYCGNCGSIVQAGDQFCGVCGSRIPPDAQDAAPTREIPTLVPPPSTVPARGRNRSLILAAVVGSLLVLTLMGTGAMALTGLGPGGGLLGGTGGDPSGGSDASGGRPEAQQPATPSSASPEATTSPQEPTPVDLLQDFVSGYYDASAREDWTATYSMLDEESQQEFTEEEWTEAQAAHEASSGSPPVASAAVEGPYFSHTQTPFSTNVNLTYEDGTSETVEVSLVSEDVVDEASDYYRYLTNGEVSDLKELLGEGSVGESTMSSTPEPTTSSPYGLSPEVEDQVRETAEQYYYEVDSENWAATYSNLDSESKALFTEEEWAQKNQWYADNENLKLDSIDVDVTMEGDEEARVTVDRIFTDGTAIRRETAFVWNNTYWSHHLTEEEKEIFMPDASYEEFVEAQQ